MSQPIRILDLRSSGWVDGPGRTVLDTASSINRAHCEIIVGGFVDNHESGGKYVQEAKRRGLKVETIREKSSFDTYVVEQIVSIVRQHSIDMIHTHDFRSNVYGFYCAKRLGLSIVTTCHGWIANDLRGKVYTAIDRILLRYFDHVIVVSRVMKDRLARRGLNETKITVVQNALVVEDYRPCRSNQVFREELGLQPSTMIISNIGRLSPEKGQRQFLLAAQELTKVFRDVHFVLVGHGEDESSLRGLVSSCDLSACVSLVGYRDDMVSVYDSTDLVVQSSSTEGMPNVILEALLMETPVVATDVGGTSEVLDGGSYGRLVEANSLPQLCRGIAEFLETPDHLQDMARRGRQSVIERFNNEDRVEVLTQIYDEIGKRKIR